jgi:hypothetical protein
VVEATARLERDGAASSGIGYRVHDNLAQAHQLFFRLRCNVLDGAPHRARTGVEVTLLSVRLYEANAESDDVAKELTAFGTAKLLGEITASWLRAA